MAEIKVRTCDTCNAFIPGPRLVATINITLFDPDGRLLGNEQVEFADCCSAEHVASQAQAAAARLRERVLPKTGTHSV